MSERIGNMIVISEEGNQTCQFCGKNAECRPYGPGGKQICYDCAFSSPEMAAIAEHNLDVILFGDKKPIRNIGSN